MIHFLDQAAQNAYSDLLAASLEPAFDGTGISFSKKQVKGKCYVYVNAKVGRIPVQRYIGADTPETQQLIESEKQLWQGSDASRVTRAKLVKMLHVAGANGPHAQEGRVLRLLERGGVFLSGGTLIGTPAFNVMATMLGVLWQTQFATRDVDIASNQQLPVAVTPQELSMKELLQSANMGFIEVPTLNPKHPSTRYKMRQGDFRVELLTPEVGKPDKRPVHIPHLRAMAEPLRFLDFILQNTQPAVVLFDIGLLVNVPDPAYFAIHKLAISQRRETAFAVKVKKDIQQAAQLIEVLAELQPGNLFLAHEAARQYQKKFFDLYQKAVLLLPDEQRSMLNSIIAEYSGA